MTEEEREEFFHQMEQLEKMEDLKFSTSSIFLQTLDVRLPKGYIKTQGNHENV